MEFLTQEDGARCLVCLVHAGDCHPQLMGGLIWGLGEIEDVISNDAEEKVEQTDLPMGGFS